MKNKDRLFIGCFPCGIVYADRSYQINGDYKKVAFLPYSTLELEWSKEDLPFLGDEFLAAIIRDADAMKAKRGQRYQIAGNVSIVLGEK